MAHQIVGAQFADYVAENGGGSFNFATGKPAEGPGFMVGRTGTEKTLRTASPSAEHIQDYVDEQYPHVAGNRDAHLGAWVVQGQRTALDVSDKHSVGSEARRAGREHLQEAAYALGSGSSPSGTPTRISSNETTDTLHRPWGADVLLNLGRSPKAEREAARVVGVEGPRKRTTSTVPKRPDEDTPIYRDMADRRVQANEAWARSKNPNDFNLNEVDNDAWSMTNRQNKRTVEEDGSRRRTNLGDVLRTINEGRTREARGEGLVAHPTKGWHRKNAGPSKVKPSQFERTPVEYNEALEAERP